MFRTKPFGLLIAVCLLAAAFLAVTLPPTANAQQPSPAANPDLEAACGLDVVLVLDESGSIWNPGGGNPSIANKVRDGAQAFVSALADTGSNVAVIEFNSLARTPIPYTEVTSGGGGTLATVFSPYLYNDPNQSENSNFYDPEDYRTNRNFYTNWEAAFRQVQTLQPGPKGTMPLVVFFTDGNPTAYLTSPTTYSTSNNSQRLNNAITAANDVKASGSHVFVVGVPNPNVRESNVRVISGNDKLPPASFATADYAIVSNANDLAKSLRQIAFNLCSPSFTVTKLVDNGQGYQPAAGWAFSGDVAITQAGQSATNFEWVNPVNGRGESIGTVQGGVTDASGTMRWQWTPGSKANPQLWSSQIVFEETQQAGYSFAGASCTRKTLDLNGGFQEQSFDLNSLPATVTFGPNDIVTCLVRNASDSAGGVSSGSSGGLESQPLDVEPSSFLEDDPPAVIEDPTVPKPHKARPQAPTSLNLADLLPENGPDGTTATAVVPVDVLAVTDAPDAKAVDFVDANGNVRAVALGIYTLDRPYEHDYGVCNRFKEYTFEDVRPIQLSGLQTAQPETGMWFWNTKGLSETNLREDAFTFHVFVDEASRTLHIDSRWIQNSYPDTFDFAFDYVFNMQVWSASQQTSAELLRGIMTNMQQMDNGSWDLVFHNVEAPQSPTLFITHTRYETDTVSLSIKNNSGERQTARLYGTWRSYTDRNTLIPIEMEIEAPPGIVEITLPFPGLLDATLFLEHNGFTDKIYNGGGLWFTFTNDDLAEASFELGQCRGLDGIREQDLLLAGCVTFTAANTTTADAVGLGRTLNPNGRPVDVSPYESLRFWARGDGNPVRILLETNDITDGDFYQLTLTPGSDWQQYTLPLDEFTQRGYGAARPLNLAELRSVIWLNAAATSGTFQLELDQVSFTNSDAVQLVQQPTDSSDTGPRTVAITAGTAQQATLFYSLDLGQTYTAVAMTRSGSQFSAAIPGQPLGSDVLYYIETATSDGYTQRLPLDAPAAAFRYRVDDRATLLVDDFGGGHASNRLTQPAGTYDDGANGRISAVTERNTLTLSYDVGSTNAFAGYFSLLGGVNASAYNTLNVLARGAVGGEQLLISLKDRSGFEPRISAGDVLPGGLTDEWQWIQLPLEAFDRNLNRANLESVAFSFAHGHGRNQGTVYIREIRFTTLPAPRSIDMFDDGNLQLNGRGQAYWQTAENGTLAATAVRGDAQMSTGYALQLDYGVQMGGYALWASPLAGLQAAPDMALSFFVRGVDPAFVPNLYLSDGSNRARVALAPYLAPGSGWQPVSIPLSAFAGVDAGSLQELQVAFEFGSGSGSIWLDQISIGRTGIPRAERRTVHLDGVHSYAAAIHSASNQPITVSVDRPWLAVSRPVASPTTLNVQAVGAGMEPGTYTGQVTLANAAGASETITIVLTIQPDTQASYLFFPMILR